MKPASKLAPLLVVLLLSGCAENKDSFTLVCDTERVTEYFAGEKYSKKSNKESLTFKFVNQGLNGFECDVWSDAEIRCYQRASHPIWIVHELKFDRVSGHFRGFKQFGWITEKNRDSSTWRGQCTKSEKAKF